jgi:uncharacterized Zn finger protein (UPF0148 family)
MGICPNCGMWRPGTPGRFCPDCRKILPYVSSFKREDPFDRKKILAKMKEDKQKEIKEPTTDEKQELFEDYEETQMKETEVVKDETK